MRERLLSVIGARAKNYLDRKVPSSIIPFTGSFPLLNSVEFEDYVELLKTKMYIADLPEELQKITLLGNKMALMEESFKEYLKRENLEFKTMNSKEKTSHLLVWLEEDNLSTNDLKIKL